MSFLDNLENDLKALEGRDEGGVDNGAFRDKERKAARASAQSAEKLRQSPWTQKVMQQVTVAGHARRLKINLVWAGTILRLEARRNRLELRPMPTGIEAVFGRGIDDLERQPVDLASDPAGLIAKWMAMLDAQLKLDEEQTQSIPEAESE